MTRPTIRPAVHVSLDLCQYVTSSPPHDDFRIGFMFPNKHYVGLYNNDEALDRLILKHWAYDSNAGALYSPEPTHRMKIFNSEELEIELQRIKNIKFGE